MLVTSAQTAAQAWVVAEYTAAGPSLAPAAWAALRPLLAPPGSRFRASHVIVSASRRAAGAPRGSRSRGDRVRGAIRWLMGAHGALVPAGRLTRAVASSMLRERVVPVYSPSPRCSVRRCLHAFLIAVLLLAPTMNTARACWHLRARRHCPPGHVTQECPPQAWSPCGDVVIVRDVVVGPGCCEPIVCPPPQACCGEVAVAETQPSASPEMVAPAETPSVVAEPPPEAPTPVPEEVATSNPLEPVTEPVPDLRPLVEAEPVTPASNDEPVVDAATPSVKPETVAEEPVATPAPAPVEDKPVATDPPQPEVTPEVPPVVVAPEVIEEPVAPIEPAPEPTLPPAQEPAAVEPPESESQPQPEPTTTPATTPAITPEAAPTQTPEVQPEPTPEPVAPVTPATPAPPPAPAEPNLFEEADGVEAAPVAVEAVKPLSDDTENAFDDEQPRAPAPAADNPPPTEDSEQPSDGSPPADPVADPPAADPSATPEPAPADAAAPSGTQEAPAEAPQNEPAEQDEPSEPAASDPFAPTEGAAAAPAPADPFEPEAGDPAPVLADPFAPEASDPVPAAPVPEEAPAAADDFVTAAEPARRWIHASGSHALVATLVDVSGNGTCVLMADGVRLRVPLDNLSGHDRDYVEHAGPRIAALRSAKDRAVKAAATTPPPNDTAGL